MRFHGVLYLVAAALAAVAAQADSQAPDSLLRWAVAASASRVYPGVVYERIAGRELKLDIVALGGTGDPKPVLVYFHGGGWTGGTRDDKTMAGLPFLAAGIDFVNADYRLAKEAVAPAAVDDCRAALRWVCAHARQYGFDPAKVIVGGESAGGHLALMAAMLESGRLPPGQPAAVISYSGPIDLLDLMHGPHPLPSTAVWLGPKAHRDELGRELSPLSHVRPGLPLIILAHGDPDPVDFSQAERLHAALDRAGDRNVLIRIPGPIHGWNVQKSWDAQRQVFAALRRYGVIDAPPAVR